MECCEKWKMIWEVTVWNEGKASKTTTKATNINFCPECGKPLKENKMNKEIEELARIILETCDKEINDKIGFMLLKEEALMFAKAILDKGYRKPLRRERFRNILCEYPPNIAKDSGQPEWSQGELDKVYDILFGKLLKQESECPTPIYITNHQGRAEKFGQLPSMPDDKPSENKLPEKMEVSNEDDVTYRVFAKEINKIIDYLDAHNKGGRG